MPGMFNNTQKLEGMKKRRRSFYRITRIKRSQIYKAFENYMYEKPERHKIPLKQAKNDDDDGYVVHVDLIYRF